MRQACRETLAPLERNPEIRRPEIRKNSETRPPKVHRGSTPVESARRFGFRLRTGPVFLRLLCLFAAGSNTIERSLRSLRAFVANPAKNIRAMGVCLVPGEPGGGPGR